MQYLLLFRSICSPFSSVYRTFREPPPNPIGILRERPLSTLILDCFFFCASCIANPSATHDDCMQRWLLSVKHAILGCFFLFRNWREKISHVSQCPLTLAGWKTIFTREFSLQTRTTCPGPVAIFIFPICWWHELDELSRVVCFERFLLGWV